MNTDTEFLSAAEEALKSLEGWLDGHCPDADWTRSGNVLTIELDSGEQVVVNLQTPLHEIWSASRKGGYHFAQQPDGSWRDGSGRTLRESVAAALAALGADVQ
jgi:CyaY protein